MSITINAVIRKDKINQNDCAPINLRLTLKSKSKYVSTGVTLPLEAWNAENQSINPDYPSAGELQFKVDSTRREYEKKIKRLQALDIEVNFDTLLETNGRKTVITVEDGFKAEIERLESRGVYSSAGKHKSALLALGAYKSTKIALETIDIDYLKGFELYLRKRGNKDNSIATRFAIFKAIYNKAVKEGKFVPKKNPFTTFKVGSLWTATRKRAINKEEIQKIANLEIPHNHRSDYKRLARDLFLFSYFTAGMNFNDIARLRHKDIINDRVYYSRHKTQKLLSFNLTPQAKEIIERWCSPFWDDDDYIFPIFDKNVHKTDQQKFNRIVKSLRKVNYCLKAIGEEIGLPFPLTTYVARHTLATIASEDCGISEGDIAMMLNHVGDKSLKVTRGYIHKRFIKIDDLQRRVLDFVKKTNTN